MKREAQRSKTATQIYEEWLKIACAKIKIYELYVMDIFEKN